MSNLTNNTTSLQEILDAVNALPDAGGSGPLQEKSVEPTHSVQEVLPDDGYGGLSKVTVGAVPRLPACEASVFTSSGISYYINRKLRPEIPAEMLALYPYAVLLVSTDGSEWLWLSTQKMYVAANDEGVDRLNIPANRAFFGFNSEANAWVLYEGYTTTGGYTINGFASWSVWWSNHDIPNGSPDAEEIYFPASAPQTEQPADATHYYYNGVKLPKIPEDVLAANPYAFIVPMLSDGVFSETTYDLIIGPNVWYLLSNGNMINCTTCEYYRYRCEIGDSAWTLINTYNDYGGWGSGRQYNVVWANQNILFGSATATDIHVPGTHAVPDPLQGGA